MSKLTKCGKPVGLSGSITITLSLSSGSIHAHEHRLCQPLKQYTQYSLPKGLCPRSIHMCQECASVAELPLAKLTGLSK